MTTCTPIYGIPIIEGSDRPCDAGTTICDIATVVETELDRFDELQSRTGTTVPLLKLASTIGQTFTTSSTDTSIPVVFDTVMVDTDNMFNSGFPSDITFNTPGIWLVNANVWTHSTGAGGLQLSSTINVVIPPGLSGFVTTTALSATQTFPSPLDIYNNGSVTFPVLAATTGFVQISFFPNGTDTITEFYADASFAWLGDVS
jgi:hypothetical protein